MDQLGLMNRLRSVVFESCTVYLMCMFHLICMVRFARMINLVSMALDSVNLVSLMILICSNVCHRTAFHGLHPLDTVHERHQAIFIRRIVNNTEYLQPIVFGVQFLRQLFDRVTVTVPALQDIPDVIVQLGSPCTHSCTVPVPC